MLTIYAINALEIRGEGNDGYKGNSVASLVSKGGIKNLSTCYQEELGEITDFRKPSNID